jgi:hypothetical protein
MFGGGRGSDFGGAIFVSHVSGGAAVDTGRPAGWRCKGVE